MNSRNFYNENLKERKTYLLWLLLIIAGLIGLQLLYPTLRPHLDSGSTARWVLTLLAILVVTVYFIFHKRFVSMTFDDSNKKIILITTTLINGTKTSHYNYSDIIFNEGKDKGSLRKKATDFIEIYAAKQKLVRLEKTSIGEYSFDQIVKEFRRVKDLV